jgi:BNR/Asp-box repeat
VTELQAATGDGVARIVVEDGEARVSLSARGSGARCLALDPRDLGTLYAGAGSGVIKSVDGGRSWARTPFVGDVFSIAFSPADGAVYAGTEPSALFRSDDGGENWEELAALRELPSAPTWSFPPRPWTSHVRWVAPNPHEPERLIVGIELGGLMLSEDRGRTWLDHRPEAQPDVHALAWHPRVDGRAYEAGGGGAAWSRDGGRSWERADAGRDRDYTWALAVDPDDPDRWYVSANPGPMQAHRDGNAEALIYRWEGEGPWRALDGGLPQPLDSMPYGLATSGPSLYAGLRDGSLYASDDRGESWRRLGMVGDPLDTILALLAPPA